VYETIADLRNHLAWSGERAASETFKLLSLEAPDGPATVGTAFSSSGSADNGTFHDRSEVTVAAPPSAFVIETDAHLDRKRGKPWDAHFVHRYDIEPEGGGSRITYTENVERVNYVPYWLQPGIRSVFKVYVNRADRRQLENLAKLAEERAAER
jgi:hypothetical protein